MTQEIRYEEGVEYLDDDDEFDDLRRLVIHINARIRSMRISIKKTNSSSVLPPGDPYPFQDPDPGPTITEGQENMPTEEKRKVLTEALSKIYDPEQASDEAKRILETKLKTEITTAQLASDYFFDVEFSGGVTLITLNESHPAYKHIVGVIEKIPEDIDMKDIKNIMIQLRAAVNLIFVSWAYYENHTLSDEDGRNLRHVRYTWSRGLSQLMKTLEN